MYIFHPRPRSTFQRKGLLLKPLPPAASSLDSPPIQSPFMNTVFSFLTVAVASILYYMTSRVQPPLLSWTVLFPSTIALAGRVPPHCPRIQTLFDDERLLCKNCSRDYFLLCHSRARSPFTENNVCCANIALAIFFYFIFLWYYSRAKSRFISAACRANHSSPAVRLPHYPRTQAPFMEKKCRLFNSRPCTLKGFAQRSGVSCRANNPLWPGRHDFICEKSASRQ